MSEHTKGPWNTDHHPGDVWAANGRFIADCHSGIIKEQFEESCANAHLIAAAPETAAERDRLKASNAELVGALQDWLHACDHGYHGDINAARVKARAVLKTTKS